MTLADQIEAEAGALAFDYPKGASPEDIAGYFGAPISQVESALARLLERGADLAFMLPVRKESARLQGDAYADAHRASTNAKIRNADAVQLGKKGGTARAAALSGERRSEIAKDAAHARWGDKAEGVVLTGRDGGPLSDILQEAMKSMGAPVDELGHGLLTPVIQKNGIVREPTTTEILVERLRPLLPEFANRFPFGMTARDLRNHTNASQNVVYEAIQKLVLEGLGIWESEMDGKSNTHRFYVRGMRQLPPGLTNNQEAVYESAMRLARNGIARINCANVDKENKLPAGSTMTVLYTLERKGLVRRITPYQYEGKKESPEYEVLPMEPREIDWPPRIEPIAVEEEPLRDSRSSDGRRIGKQIRRAKADYTKPQDDFIQSLAFRRKFLQEELRSVDALLEHYKRMFGVK